LPLYADECHLCYELRTRLRAAGRHLDVLAPDACYGPPAATDSESAKEPS
jgi:hypothetical protein